MFNELGQQNEKYFVYLCQIDNVFFYLNRVRVNTCGMKAGCLLTKTGHQTNRLWRVVVSYSMRLARGQGKTVEI